MGLPYFRRIPPRRHSGSNPAVAGMKDHGKLGRGHDFVKRVDGTVVRMKLLERRVQLEAANSTRIDQPLGLAHGFVATGWIHAGESHHDVAIRSRERHHFVIRNGRPSGKTLIHRENHAADLARAIVVGQIVPAVGNARVAKILARRFVRRVTRRFRFKVHVRIDGDQLVKVKRLVSHSRDPIWLV